MPTSQIQRDSCSLSDETGSAPVLIPLRQFHHGATSGSFQHFDRRRALILIGISRYRVCDTTGSPLGIMEESIVSRPFFCQAKFLCHVADYSKLPSEKWFSCWRAFSRAKVYKK